MFQFAKNRLQIAFLCIFSVSIVQRGSSNTACLEPQYCKCLSNCNVLQPDIFHRSFLKCDYTLLVLPNLKIFWDGRSIKEQIIWAKEKLQYEAAKSYSGDGPLIKWKDHVLGSKKMGVIAMQSYLGIQFSLVKATYGAQIQERLVSSAENQKCDIAKCMAFCAKACESQCDMLESTDQTYLSEISWTKEMCDVEGSKALIATACDDLKQSLSQCDANCDMASPKWSFFEAMFFVFPWFLA
jgi:hypothetical protein